MVKQMKRAITKRRRRRILREVVTFIGEVIMTAILMLGVPWIALLFVFVFDEGTALAGI